MIAGKKILAVIPARGQSKGLPGKNIRPIAGKPLLVWTVEAAKQSVYIDRLIISSEDEAICQIAKDNGCEAPFLRPAELARDDTPGEAAPIHALQQLPGYDYVVLLQPTSPLRTVDDIDACIEKCVARDAASCVSVTEARHNPFWTVYIQSPSDTVKFILSENQTASRRQDLPAVYAFNGAVYVIKAEHLIKDRKIVFEDTLAYVMPPERSIDIDTLLDFKIAQMLLQERICAH